MRILDVVEGEKCADALLALGLLATTSQGGSGRAEETDWAPAARFELIRIWRDVDATQAETGSNPGEKYAQTVAERISAAWERWFEAGGDGGSGEVHTTAVRDEPPAAGAWPVPPAIIIVDLSREGPLGAEQGLTPGEDVWDLLAAWRGEGKDDAALRAGLEAVALQCGRRWMERVTISYPGQPAPFAARPPAADGVRAAIRNFSLVEKEVVKTDADGVETKAVKKKFLARPIAGIRGDVLELTGGWPCRVESPGARQPLLFNDPGGEYEVRWLSGVEAFEAWLHECAALKFVPKLDDEMTKFVGTGNLYQSFGGSEHVTTYKAVETRPHEPLIKGHYYKWRPPANYNPDGRYLLKLLQKFDNVKEPKDRALIAAALLTPGWGGTAEQPYGKRPMFAIMAPDRGCGKSTLARAIAKIWNGWMAIDIGERAQEEMKARMLDINALKKRIVILDNVKGLFTSAAIEALVTEETINGKRMYHGDAQRPNTLTWFVTGNGLRLSTDIASRSFIIELIKPTMSVVWNQALEMELALSGDYVVADCIAVLKNKTPSRSSTTDRWSDWVKEVLTPACAHPALAKWVGVEVDAVLAANNANRALCDEEREEAEMLKQGLLDFITGKNNLVFFANSEPSGPGTEATPYNGGFRVIKNPDGDIFIPSIEMAEMFNAVKGKSGGKKMGVTQVLHILRAHRESGRIIGINERRTAACNGYVVSKELIQSYVDEVRKAPIQQIRIEPLFTAGGDMGAVADGGREGQA